MTCRGHVRAATRPVPQHRSIPFKSTTPETPFDTYVSIRCFVFYALKALRRNTSSYHIIAVCFTVLKKRAFDPLQQGERRISQQRQIVWLQGFRSVVKDFEVLCSIRLLFIYSIVIIQFFLSRISAKEGPQKTAPSEWFLGSCVSIFLYSSLIEL